MPIGGLLGLMERLANEVAAQLRHRHFPEDGEEEVGEDHAASLARLRKLLATLLADQRTATELLEESVGDLEGVVMRFHRAGHRGAEFRKKLDRHNIDIDGRRQAAEGMLYAVDPGRRVLRSEVHTDLAERAVLAAGDVFRLAAHAGRKLYRKTASGRSRKRKATAADGEEDAGEGTEETEEEFLTRAEPPVANHDTVQLFWKFVHKLSGSGTPAPEVLSQSQPGLSQDSDHGDRDFSGSLPGSQPVDADTCPAGQERVRDFLAVLFGDSRLLPDPGVRLLDKAPLLKALSTVFRGGEVASSIIQMQERFAAPALRKLLTRICIEGGSTRREWTAWRWGDGRKAARDLGWRDNPMPSFASVGQSFKDQTATAGEMTNMDSERTAFKEMMQPCSLHLASHLFGPAGSGTAALIQRDDAALFTAPCISSLWSRRERHSSFDSKR